ncbi:hypothetical protein EYF80_020013 [Liparis tanakae]|uniref:Uncharacterized protein n=1 Tax=Liparis tanakae TaxID=230148 RepID=A0A4Z2HW18_9TELE|nr:hypothetical protein EYF80_020013 [Liparis tanakae]
MLLCALLGQIRSSNPRRPEAALQHGCSVCDLAAGRRLTCCMKAGYDTMSMIKTSTATTRTEVMVTTIFRPPLPDMLSEMGSPDFSRGGMVAESTARYSRMKEVIGQPPLFQPTRLSLALVELMLVKSSCSLANCGSEEKIDSAASMISLMRPGPTAFWAVRVNLYQVPHFRFSRRVLMTTCCEEGPVPALLAACTTTLYCVNFFRSSSKMLSVVSPVVSRLMMVNWWLPPGLYSL